MGVRMFVLLMAPGRVCVRADDDVVCAEYMGGGFNI
jgi:hypothetical protein